MLWKQIQNGQFLENLFSVRQTHAPSVAALYDCDEIMSPAKRNNSQVIESEHLHSKNG